MQPISLTALGATFFNPAFAGVTHPAFPVSSEGYQSIFLGISSEHELFNNKYVDTHGSNGLRMTAMGNTGIRLALKGSRPGPFGWNEETGVLAEKRIVDLRSFDWRKNEYEWVPLQFRVQHDGVGGPMTLPSGGLAAPVFLPYRFLVGDVKMRNDNIQSPTFDPPRFNTTADNYTGVIGPEGQVISKWYACDDGRDASGLSWSLDDTAENDPACSLVRLQKFNNPTELPTTTPSSTPPDTIPSQSHHSHVHPKTGGTAFQPLNQVPLTNI